MEPLTCANEDNTIFPFTLDLPEYKLLTRPKIACWNSHLSIIRRIAEHDGKTRAAEEQDVSVIFEDDVDMEWDIRGRLARIWTLLPVGWDVVFLGAWAMDFEHFRGSSSSSNPADIVLYYASRNFTVAKLTSSESSNTETSLLRALLVE
jgi:GR25 family glycosyltransferase involved in LPS biosynthesis